MYPFSSEGQRIVHEQIVQEAMEREHIHAEIRRGRAKPDNHEHPIRMVARFLTNISHKLKPAPVAQTQDNCP
jgi:hypothetical protein